MRKLGSWLAAAALLALSACATPESTYHPASADIKNSIGYTDQDLGTGAYRVSFTAPQNVGTAGAQDLALLRAAELTIAKGHAWFRVINQTSQMVQVERPKIYSTARQSMTCNNTASVQGPNAAPNLGCSFDPTGNVAGVEQMNQGSETRYIATIAITMGDGAMPSGDHVYDAKATADRLRAQIGQKS